MDTIVQNAIGCYGDGALGHQHTRDNCRNILEYYADENFFSRNKEIPGTMAEWNELLTALTLPMSDDAWEEYEACNWLNENAPFTGASWSWQDGDFGLWAGEDE